ncbi:MAG: LysM peptidoglycan-binding domain-containing protein [Planctomycetota bacterium]
MNASYKIALVVAVGLLIVVAGYYATRTSETPEPVADVSSAAEQDGGEQTPVITPPRDEEPTPPTRRTAPTLDDRTGPAERPAPRTAVRQPTPPEVDPADAEDTTPNVVDLGPAPGGLPSSLAEARSLGGNDTPDAAAGDLAETEPIEESTVSAGPDEASEATPTEAAPSPQPGSQPNTVTTADAAPETRPAPTERPAERAAEPRGIPATYTIQAGDMLVTIAERYYGTQAAWEAIAQANPTVDPTRLRVGQELRLPRLDAVERPRTEPPAPTPGRRDAYTVRAGDNLYRIAQRFYNDAEKWDIIYNHNRDLIGDDPGKLREGMTLVIPPAVGGAN